MKSFSESRNDAFSCRGWRVPSACAGAVLQAGLILALLCDASVARAGVDAHVPQLQQLMRQEMDELAWPLRLQGTNDGGAALPRKPVLLAIYGVGRRLAIEILHEGVVLRYVSDQRNPPEWQSEGAPLRVRKVAGRCASLEHDAGLIHTCLPYQLAQPPLTSDGASHDNR